MAPLIPKYSHKTFTIKYDSEKKLFFLWNNENKCIGEDVNGRELGRDAWRNGAEAVCYDYNLSLDEGFLLIPYHIKYKTNA